MPPPLLFANYKNKKGENLGTNSYHNHTSYWSKAISPYPNPHPHQSVHPSKNPRNFPTLDILNKIESPCNHRQWLHQSSFPYLLNPLMAMATQASLFTQPLFTSKPGVIVSPSYGNNHQPYLSCVPSHANLFQDSVQSRQLLRMAKSRHPLRRLLWDSPSPSWIPAPPHRFSHVAPKLKSSM